MYQMAKGSGRFGVVIGRDESEVTRLDGAGMLARLKGVLFTSTIDGDEFSFVLPAPWNGGLYRARRDVRRQIEDVAAATRFRKGPLEVANFEISTSGRTFRLEAGDNFGHSFLLFEGDEQCGGVTSREFTGPPGWYADLDVPDGIAIPGVAFVAFLVAEGRRLLKQARR